MRPGDLVLVHSALSSLGWVEGAEDTVIDALLEAVGHLGTVCMPAVSYGDYGPRRPPPPFDARATPTLAGRIPERFRARPDVCRSVHPTHSLAACGRLAATIVAKHERAPTPCGTGSPSARVAEAGGTVIMLGVGTRYCTLFHGPEGDAEPDERCHPPVPCDLRDERGERVVPIRLHRPYHGALSRRAALMPALEADGILTVGAIGSCVVLTINAAGLWQFASRGYWSAGCDGETAWRRGRAMSSGAGRAALRRSRG